MTTGELLAAALSTAANGLPVFPCGDNKKPCIAKRDGGRGFHDATRDPEALRKLFSHQGARMIGTPTGEVSGFDVLDLDYRKGAAAWERANRHRLPETRTHETQHRGRHLLFIHAHGVCNSEGKIAEGVDVRGRGGYIVMPPSPGYRVISDAEIVHWPGWLLELVLKAGIPPRPQRPHSSAARQPLNDKRLSGFISKVIDRVRHAPEGQKHFLLRNAALSLGGIQEVAGFSDEAAISWLIEALPATVEDWKGAEATAAWGLRAGRERPIELEERQRPARSNGKDRPQLRPGGKAPDVSLAGDGEAGHTSEVEISEADARAEIAQLARLSLLKYAQTRSASAKLVGIPVAMLDKLVALERGDGADTKGQGRPLDLPLPERWPQPIDGAALLHELAKYFTDHVVLPKSANYALALWTVHCHCFDAFRFTPRLQLKSPVRGSGKSTVIELLREVVPRPLEVETVSAAFLFRAVELIRPTVLMDEADTYLREDEELRGLVNAGVKAGGQAGRCVGDNQEPRMFSCHAPVALAGIGALPDTIEDRSIQIWMQRRTRGEAIQPIEDATRELGERLCRQAARWVADHLTELRDARPDMGTLFNRTADRWRALYSVAAIAGGEWPELAREAVRAIADVAGDEAASLGEQLLADIRRIFNEEFGETTLAPDAIALTPDALLERLTAMLNRPWPEMGKSRRPLTKNRLARMLVRFGVSVNRPWDAQTEEAGPRVYRLIDFENAFERYLDA